MRAEHLESAELEDLRHDQGDVEEHTESGESVVVARMDPTSRPRGRGGRVWLDATKLHFFDAESRVSLTERH